MKSINDYVQSTNIFEYRKKKEDVEVNNDVTVTDGKKVKVNVDKLKGKPEKVNKDRFAIDPPVDGDAERWDGKPKPENVKQLLGKIGAEEDFFVVGHRGWAKSTLIKQAAHKYGYTVIVVNLDKIPPEDLGGIPVPIKNDNTGEYEQQILMPTWAKYIYDHQDEQFMIFFDEMNQASPEVLHSLMSIILDKTICFQKFNNYFCGGAGNYADEDEAINKLPKNLLSRLKPIIIWKDKDQESWDDFFQYVSKKWEGKFNGHADELLEVVEKYMQYFDNPRELETRVFVWLQNLITRAEKTGKPIDKDVYDVDLVKDRLYGLMAEDGDYEDLRALKQKVEGDYQRKKAVEELAETMINVLYADSSEKLGTKKDKPLEKKAVMMSNEQLNKALKVSQDGYIFWPQDKEGHRVSNSDTIIVSRDNLCDIYGLTRQQQDQIETAMGDIDGANGYAWQKEADAKKKNPKMMTYAEACKKYPEFI